MKAPRAIWMMVPAGVVDATLKGLVPLLEKDDVLIDGGNSYYHDDIRRAEELKAKGIHYVDVGTSGGVWGAGPRLLPDDRRRAEVVKRLDPIFASLAPSIDEASAHPGREKVGGTAEHGYLHCGPNGAGHFVKMVHNGIEYGMMAAYAEGLNILRHANAGKQKQSSMRRPRRCATRALPVRPEPRRHHRSLAPRQRDRLVAAGPDRERAARQPRPRRKFAGRVSDSGEGRWTIIAAIDESVPTPVLSAALYERFSSRGEDEFADKLLSAMRFQFGGHNEKKPRQAPDGGQNELHFPSRTRWSSSASPATWPTR
jgi:6-phosphogluconate dehydrogenase